MTDIDAMIVDLAEDDFTGLWEFVWRAQTIWGRGQSDSVRAELGSALERLIREGKLQMYRGVSFAGEEQRIGGQEVHSVLGSPSSWEPAAAGEVHIRVATPGGSP